MIQLIFTILKYNKLTQIYYDRVIKKRSKNILSEHYIISSYPKSGNTFVRLILQSYFFHKTDLDLIDFDIPYVGKNDYRSKKLLKSHDLPNRYLSKGVFIHRDPLDSTNSLHRTSRRRGLNLSFNNFTILLNYGFLSFYSGPLNHFIKWKKHIKKYNFIEVEYNDLIKNTFEVMSKILSHYGVEVDKARLLDSISNCSLDNVKNLELKSKFIQSKLKKKSSITGAGFKTKKNKNKIVLNQSKKYNYLK